MKISDLLKTYSIDLNFEANDKTEALKKACDLMAKSNNIDNVSDYLKAVELREEESTTGVGHSIAIPHGRCKAVKEFGLAAMVLKKGVNFNSLDNKPVELIILIAAPENSSTTYMDVLSKLSMMLMDECFVKDLKLAKSEKEFKEIIDRYEDERDRKEMSKLNSDKYILAVTACPTGIAHTYMAKEAIEKACQEKLIKVKVETRGSSGVKDELTSEDIKNATAIIVAADTNVPISRFNGKKVIECSVSKAISSANELVDKILNDKVNVFESKIKNQSSQNVGHGIYKHLMNGVSYMLPFVVGGGILIALAFLVDGFAVDINSLSAADKSNFGSITEVARFLKANVGGIAFGFMLPLLSGFIALSIADRPALAIGVVGGAIAANGTSGFLGALFAGFIAGYTIIFLRKIFDKIIPLTLDGLKPVLLYPLFGMLIVGLVMVFAIEPVVGSINTSLNNFLASLSGVNVILLGLILAGMMAIDMGGPFNKASYVFGVASIASGNYNIMAAVMIGGMVPPCAIALSTLLFKNKYTESEIKSGPTNFVMGLAFITEGAIPFAASDPFRVIPSCIAGSAIAGALSMAFNCTLMAPHGGIFVFPAVGNALMYVVALVVGTLVGAILLGFLKKDVNKI